MSADPKPPADAAAGAAAPAPRRVKPGHPAPRRALDRDATGSVRAAQPTRGTPLSVAEGTPTPVPAAAPAEAPEAAPEAKPGKKAKPDKEGKGGKHHKHPKDGAAGKGGKHDRDSDEASRPPERSGVLVLPWPKANRKRLERRAAEHGMSPEQLAYQVLDVWLDDGR